MKELTLKKFHDEFKKLGDNPKTGVIDKFNKQLIRDKVNVDFLKPIIKEHEEYYRTYYQVSLKLRDNLDDKFKFIEDNFDLMHDWWHTDILMGYLGNDVNFDYVYDKAKYYVKSDMPYVRRLGYVIFIPRLVKDKKNIDKLVRLLKNDDNYHVVMAEAWLISFMAMCDVDMTYEYLKKCDLKYNIVGKAIQKICDSYVVTSEDKAKFKSLREDRKLIR